MQGDRYQYVLIGSGLLVTALFGVFFWREIAPEYKIYQDTYKELEEFRSEQTGAPVPPFKQEIKQLVFEQKDRGPAQIDRCTSCHVAVQFEHFSPTTLAKDVNGKVILDEQGFPVKKENPEYVWKMLDDSIALLEKSNPAAAERLKEMKTVEVGEHTYDMTKVLAMHPLIAGETRPFEFHPIAEYGCTVCHNGNGRGLTTEKAHGPVFDGQYEEEYMGPKPVFLETDPRNDPQFAEVFNHKPGHELLFQTSPLFVGDLIQANCVQCHKTSQELMGDVADASEQVAGRSTYKAETIAAGFNQEVDAVVALLRIHQEIQENGFDVTLKKAQLVASDYRLSPQDLKEAFARVSFLEQPNVEERIRSSLIESVGNQELLSKLDSQVGNGSLELAVGEFIQENASDPNANGRLFMKWHALQQEQRYGLHMKETEVAIHQSAADLQVAKALMSDIDLLTQSYHEGKELYISQACYACHRVAGFARGGIGPELTEIGNYYPWHIKESMVWPQADLKTSTMPNYKLDHEELEKLMTYLLAQKGQPKNVSDTEYKVTVQKWDEGKKKLPWEEPFNPGKLQDLDESMIVFATQGCAACHRLKGFESDIGFAVEKGGTDFQTLYEEKQWFRNLFPEEIAGSEIVKSVEQNSEAIDSKIVNGVRQNSILEKIEKEYPDLIGAFYSNFRYATRAKNAYFAELEDRASTDEQREAIAKEKQEWKDRIHRLRMIYVQEYGLGRLIGPRPNWSGVYRSNEWLVQHFRKPSAYVARSLMPVFPFDDSKFYALTYMLNVLGQKNRDSLHEIWDNRGFDPELAYQELCSQCHGEYLKGNGPVSEWIYPIPKNLKNADFLRHLTKERVIYSLVHGIKGGPMPPWGEVADDKEIADGVPVLSQDEARQLTDWMFSSLMGGTVIKGSEDVPKWKYNPSDILEELKDEGNVLQPGPVPKEFDVQEMKPTSMLDPDLPLFASVEPMLSQTTDVNEVFDILPSNEPGPDRNLYYIKKKYYTKENIAAGQQYFEVQCAVCHGKEMDGQGFRAGTMFDAKPRMLSNLSWLESRDDLRLIRSIKYGVKGTSMTPWGDMTSSLLRMQLVMYIRTLQQAQQQRDQLLKTLYSVFDQADQIIDQARIQEYKEINAIKTQRDQLNEERLKLYEEVEKGEAQPNIAVSVVEKELTLTRKLKQHEEADQQLLKLKAELKNESQIYQNLGVNIIMKTMLGDLFELYIKAISIDNIDYHVKEGILDSQFHEAKEEEIQQIEKLILQELEIKVEQLNEKEKVIEGKLASAERNEELQEVREDIQSLKKLKLSIVQSFEEAKRSRERQQQIVSNYQEKLEAL